MKALIIGVAGFVGPYLAKAIKESMFCEVIATKLENETVEMPGVRIRNLNILDYESIVKLLSEERPEYIFHLAAQSSVGLSWKKPALTVNINIKGAINLLNAIRTLDYSPRVLMVGSGEEYGRIENGVCPINEETKLNPGNIYAVTKACQNMMSTVYAGAYEMQVIMTRSFNHVGPGQLPMFVVADFCRQAVMIEEGMQEPTMRVGNLSAMRDFTDVRDVVRAYCSLIRFGKPGETYNVGSGHAIAIREILDMIVEQSTADIKVEIDPAKLRPVDVPIIEADTGKLYAATGWKPEIPLEQTIAETLDYWRSELRRGKR